MGFPLFFSVCVVRKKKVECLFVELGWSQLWTHPVTCGAILRDQGLGLEGFPPEEDQEVKGPTEKVNEREERGKVKGMEVRNYTLGSTPESKGKNVESGAIDICKERKTARH